MIAIIDYDAGNIKSVEKACSYLGKEVVVTRDKEKIVRADHVILPGVGAYSDCMHKLETYDLVDTIKAVVDKKTPFLGICLGLQLLFESSEEGGGFNGLGILQGKIVKIPDQDKQLKVPQIGWNSLHMTKESRLFQGIKEDSFVYFVHSYYLQAKDPSIVAATTEYGVTIHAAVEKDNIFACQFHPEKSGEVGLTILKNFMEI